LYSRIILVLAALLAVAARGTAAELGPFAHLPAVSGFAISPDGERIALLRTQDGVRMLVVAAVDGDKPLAVVQLGETIVAGLQWADGDHVMLGIQSRELGVGLSASRGNDGEWSTLRVYDVAANKIFDALAANSEYKTINVLTARPRLRRANGEVHLLLKGIYYDHNQGRPALYSTPMTGVAQLVERGDTDLRSWVIDASDNIIAAETYAFTSHSWSLRARHGDRFDEVSRSVSEADQPGVWGVSPAGDSLWVHRYEGDTRVTRAVSLATGAVSEPLADIRDPEVALVERYSDRVMGAYDSGDRNTYRFFGAGMQKAWENVLAGLPGRSVRMLSYSDDYTRWTLVVDDPASGPAYVLADLRKGKLRRFGLAYEGLQGMAPVRAFTYKAADGLQIPAYLTVPRGREARRLPLIVLAHTSDSGRDTAEFDMWSQALAVQGYAVLRANVRGSGLGWGFVKAGFGQWGRKIQSDLADGVATLAAEGTIDPARVCIMGSRFGGYAALAGVTLTQGLYRCAVSIGGISDFRKLRDSWYGDGRNETPATRYFDRLVGASGPGDLALDQISPFHHAGDLNVPLLLVHERHDPVVPEGQSNMMVDALKKAGKKPGFVTLESGASKEADSKMMMQSVVDFLRANNPPD
jgi:dipeptidyl aminopeptidase/acylaminoacyl peptidase